MLANSLENPLENEVAIIEERDVAPSLGRDSIRKGYKAALWGLIGVAIFMVIYYLLSGVLANFALALNIVMILGILCGLMPRSRCRALPVWCSQSAWRWMPTC